MDVASWDPLGGLLGRLGAILGASWAVLERREAEEARTPKSFKKQLEINEFSLLGPSWECSWRPLGASCRPFGPFGRHLGRLGAIVRRVGAFLDCSESLGLTTEVQGIARGSSQQPPRASGELPGAARSRRAGLEIAGPGWESGGPGLKQPYNSSALQV